MTKKKNDSKKELQENTLAKPLNFDDKTVADCYEGLVCLDIKLSKLIDILEPVAKYIEDKRNGCLTI